VRARTIAAGTATATIFLLLFVFPALVGRADSAKLLVNRVPNDVPGARRGGVSSFWWATACASQPTCEQTHPADAMDCTALWRGSAGAHAAHTTNYSTLFHRWWTLPERTRALSLLEPRRRPTSVKRGYLAGTASCTPSAICLTGISARAYSLRLMRPRGDWAHDEQHAQNARHRHFPFSFPLYSFVRSAVSLLLYNSNSLSSISCCRFHLLSSNTVRSAVSLLM